MLQIRNHYNLEATKTYSIRYKKFLNNVCLSFFQLVMKDPHLNICELYLRKDDDANPVYTLKCWEADRDKQMTFGQSKGYHVLFYSATAFKWRGLVPVKAKCDD